MNAWVFSFTVNDSFPLLYSGVKKRGIFLISVKFNAKGTLPKIAVSQKLLRAIKRETKTNSNFLSDLGIKPKYSVNYQYFNKF